MNTKENVMKSKVLIMAFLLSILCLNGWSTEQQSGKKLVYSVSGDGYVNVRMAPNSSSKIIGVLATNRQGATLLSSKGTWWKVRIDNVVGYVHSKYVKLSDTPVKVKDLPTYYYTVVATCDTREEVDQYFYRCPDFFDGSPVYKDIVDGKTVYKICTACFATYSGAKEWSDTTDQVLGYSTCTIWRTQGLAECVYLPMTPADEMAIPLTPQ